MSEIRGVTVDLADGRKLDFRMADVLRIKTVGPCTIHVRGGEVLEAVGAEFYPQASEMEEKNRETVAFHLREPR